MIFRRPSRAAVFQTRSLRFIARAALVLACCFCVSSAACAQNVAVNGRVEFVSASRASPADEASGVVFWLAPLGDLSDAERARLRLERQSHPSLTQKHKAFHPHILVIPAGTAVDFPNQDPFFHNVFSLFNGKRFDLGLYEAGSTRQVLFDRPGISYIFCNIHPEMSAVVIALTTPYYAISDRRGALTIPGVPPGRYTLHVWHERSLPSDLEHLVRQVTIGEDLHSLGTLHLTAAPALKVAHKNKYGRDYDEPTPQNPLYQSP